MWSHPIHCYMWHQNFGRCTSSQRNDYLDSSFLTHWTSFLFISFMILRCSITILLLSHILPLTVSFPGHLQPHWSRIFYRYHRSHRWLRIFYTSEMSISDNFESYRRDNTLLSKWLWPQHYCVPQCIHSMSKTISLPTTTSTPIFLVHVLLERTILICLTPPDRVAQMMMLSQSLLNLIHGSVSTPTPK